jgi:hypothetical protein
VHLCGALFGVIYRFDGALLAGLLGATVVLLVPFGMISSVAFWHQRGRVWTRGLTHVVTAKPSAYRVGRLARRVLCWRHNDQIG